MLEEIKQNIIYLILMLACYFGGVAVGMDYGEGKEIDLCQQKHNLKTKTVIANKANPYYQRKPTVTLECE